MAQSEKSDILWLVGLDLRGGTLVKVPNRGRLYDVEAVVKELRDHYPGLEGTPLTSVVPIFTPQGDPS